MLSYGERGVFKAEPYLNDLNETINPGDKVLFVSKSGASVKVRTGVYDGVFRDKDGEITAQRVRHYPGFRYDVDGEREYSYVNYKGETVTWKSPNYVKVEDPNYSKVVVLYLGRIYLRP